MKRRWLATLLVVSVMGTMLVGCTDTTEGGNGDGAGTGAEAGTGEGEENTLAESDVPEGAVELDLYVDASWYPTDSWTGIIPEELTKNGGVHFNVTRAADSSQLGLMIASGELPDVIFTGDEIDRLCDSEQCWSYDELIQQYGIDWQPTEDRIAIARSHNVNPEDEHYYTLIQNYSSDAEWAAVEGVRPNSACAYYRKDIWEALGSPKMDTKEDVLNVLRMVKEKYPDMIPLSGADSNWRFGPMALWEGVNNQISFMYDENGNPVYKDTTTQFYNYLKLINQMYREGLFPLENLAITNSEDVTQQVWSGKCFMYEWDALPTKVAQLNTNTQVYVPEAEWLPLIFVEDNEPVIRSAAGWAGVFISKNCKDPEAAIKMIAYMNSEEGQRLALWGREGEEYTLNEQGVPEFSDEWNEAQKDSAKMTSKYNNNYYLCASEVVQQYAFYSGVDQEVLDAYGKHAIQMENRPELVIAQPTSTSDMGVVKAKLDEAREAELVKIYTAATEEEFEAAYQSYIELMDKIGVQDLNAYMKENVAEVDW